MRPANRPALRHLLAGALVLAACGDASPGSGTDPGDSTTPSESPIRVGFFVTSIGSGQGGNLGGPEGADARCTELADAAGLQPRTWRAYLSTSGPVHARDRIGTGPWLNAAGVAVADNVTGLDGGFDSTLMLDEFGDSPAKSAPPGIEHDIVTGSDRDGRLHPSGATCLDWTSDRAEDRVRVGHHDWSFLLGGQQNQDWLSVHGSPCDIAGMQALFGTARTYCFAAD